MDDGPRSLRSVKPNGFAGSHYAQRKVAYTRKFALRLILLEF
jgi:hypothetical protein